MAKPIPEQSNLISIGAWNPAILQPNWLKKNFPDQIPEKVNLQVSTVIAGNLATSLILDLGKFKLDPNGGRLIFIPKELDKETLSLISSMSSDIWKMLSHTPVSAAGCNFTFILEESEHFAIEDEHEQPEDVYKPTNLGSCISRSIRHTFSFENHNINLNYLISEEQRELRINYDYQSPVDAFNSASKNFFQDFEQAVQLCSQLVRR